MDIKICVIGLGYVGLPLAVEFSKKYNTIGFDIDSNRINELKNGIDNTKEVNLKRALKNKNLHFTDNEINLKYSNFYIITVPTPIDDFKIPDLSFLIKATELVSKFIKKNDYVIYESTVYPGCTEEICIPIIEKNSNLKLNLDFYVGYSPERINPGDKKNKLTNIKKVTSGSNLSSSKVINGLYKSIIKAGTYLAPSIKVAEASKAIENAQRDLNISFVNELSIIFDKIGIDTNEVLEAASTKWNFMNFKPGLVGGHCISVDPYYLVHKSISLGYEPEVILSGRKVNENIPSFIVEKCMSLMIKKGNNIKNSNAIILGATFKENCPDTRNSKVPEIYLKLKKFGVNVEIYDPLVQTNDKLIQKLKFVSEIKELKYQLIILAVPHKDFKKLNFSKLKFNNNSVLFDVKGFLKKEIVDGRL